MTNEHLPPAPDLKELILLEHRRAELQRLDEGLPGCGCSDCQTFYQTIDLGKYGKRVKVYGDYILVVEKSRQNTDKEVPENDSYGQADPLQSIAKLTVKESSQPVVMQRQKHGGGRPQKPAGEQVNKSTLWRRSHKASQGGLL